MTSFTLDLQGGKSLYAGYVPGRKKPYLGIMEGNTLVALAEFISDEDLQYFHDVFKKRLIVVREIDTDEFA